jgi:threonine aldolase
MDALMIDLRSDTVTRPTAEMRTAMYQAEVHDDVIDMDPTTEQLQQRIARMLGKEAAVFVPSGTMSNQIAVRVHCQPGDQLICDVDCHIYRYEQGGFAQLSGVVAHPIDNQGQGFFSAQQLRYSVQPDDDHYVRTRLVCLENTHNKGGGIVLPLDQIRSVCQAAKDFGLATHLDGARLFNAVIASGISASEWAEPFDTVSVCFSKGLGAPVGSALVGPQQLIQKIRRARKLLGGGMRQSGMLAAAALWALDHHIPRLAEDHANARLIAQRIVESPQIELDLDRVQTNIVIFKIAAAVGTPREFCQRAYQKGVWMFPFGPDQVRLVTHLHIDPQQARKAADVIRSLAER